MPRWQIRPVFNVPTVLAAYRAGFFPMGDDRGEIGWYNPDPRAIFELDRIAVSRSLRKTITRRIFEVRVNTAFAETMQACAARHDEDGTWITPDIHRVYHELHQLGWAHSLETWRDDQLAGGLYGVAIGGAFFGESMFHRQTDASKVALVALGERLRQRGFTLLDAQFLTPHLESLGAIEIRRHDYLQRLSAAIAMPCIFDERRRPPVDPQA